MTNLHDLFAASLSPNLPQLVLAAQLTDALDQLVAGDDSIAFYAVATDTGVTATLHITDAAAWTDFPQTPAGNYCADPEPLCIRNLSNTAGNFSVVDYRADSRLAALTGLVRAYITARPDSELAETVATLGITA